ncbi:MAG: glycosyltransferase family 39 protein [bacterium]|nr:glycosyltransferase family 39 protein [bacterium]
MLPRKKLIVNGIALAMLAVMGGLMFLSIEDDAIIIDEDPHIGAGYSYLRTGDFRLNPEHPPLMKDLGALPLLWMNLKEPWGHKSWVSDINGQWEFGRALIFGSGNDADAITQAVKIPMMLFTLFLGLIIFLWTKKEFGEKTALLATFFYAFSPTFLAHGRFVTTDVGASAGFFVATIAFLRFLKNPTDGNVLWAGLALGFAFLVKFNTFMLLPIFFIMMVLWVIAYKKRHVSHIPPSQHAHLPFSGRGETHAEEHFEDEAERHAHFWPMLFKFIAVVIVAYIAIYPLYWHHTRNYPNERQKADTTQILTTYSVGAMRGLAALMQEKDIYPQYAPYVLDFPKNLVIWGSDKLLLKPYAEYFLGLLMVFQRVAGGNTTYFLGEVSKYGSPWYFPVVYALKEPLTIHLLTIIALIFALTGVRGLLKGRAWLRAHFTEIAFLLVAAFYWWTSVRAILNIGVRHILPAFPFIYIVVSQQIITLYKKIASPPKTDPAIGAIPATMPVPKNSMVLIRWGLHMILGALMLWQALSVLRVHPFYLAYFNEMAGGPDGGAEYVTDSNLDWGQDLKRLAQFVEERDIKEIWFDYFGWADPYYYLKEKRKWLSSSDGPKKGWVAVSASFYQGSRQNPKEDYRLWLTPDKLVATIGHSIYVFYVE